MKHYITIKSSLIWILFFFFTNQLFSQTTCVVSGVNTTVTITATGTSSTSTGGDLATSCPSVTNTSGAWDNFTVGGFVRYTYSQPVSTVRIAFIAINLADIGTISVNNGGTMTLSNPCNFVIQPNGIDVKGVNNTTTSWVTVSSTIPFTTVQWTNKSGTSGAVSANTCQLNVCQAGNNSPLLVSSGNFSGNTLIGTCGSSTVNLSGITASNTPSTTSLTWHTGTPATSLNQISNPSSVSSPGTYYAAFSDTSFPGGCFSNTTLVTVVKPTCIVAANDSYSVAAGANTTTSSVIVNDTNNSSPVTLGSGGNSTLSWITSASAGFTLNSDGTISISSSVPSGTYNFTYQICDKVTTTSCTTAVATVDVSCGAGSVAPVIN